MNMQGKEKTNFNKNCQQERPTDGHTDIIIKTAAPFTIYSKYVNDDMTYNFIVKNAGCHTMVLK